METTDILLRNIDKYFNETMPNIYKYNERFTVEHDRNNGRFILISDRNSYLIYLLRKEGKSTIHQLESRITNFLYQLYSIKYVVTLSLFDKNKIIITYSKDNKLSNITELGIYANIASSLTNQQLLKLCVTDKQFSKVCNNNEFWSLLFMKRYPEYVSKSSPSENYNWKEIYFGMDNFIKRLDIYDLSQNYPQLLKYLIFEKLIKLDQESIGQLVITLFVLKNFKILERVLQDYQDVIRDNNLIGNILNEIDSNDLFQLDRLLSKYNLNIGTRGKLMTIKDYELTSKDGLDLDRYIFMASKLGNTADDYLDDFINVNTEKDYDNSLIFVNYILSQLPEVLSNIQVMNVLTDLINQGESHSKAVVFYLIYGKRLSREDKDQLILLATNTHGESSYFIKLLKR